MTEQSPDHYVVLAFYLFAPIENPPREIADQKRFLKVRDATARIYISEEGINGQMSASPDDAEAYIEWMHGRAPFQNVEFKAHTYHEQAFPRLCIKYRKQLVAVDRDVDMSRRGEHVAPKRWKEMLEDDQERILIDVRNDYECDVGHFEGAECPPCRQFREFPDYVRELKKRIDPGKTPVMMYCTGGIRCEVFSALMMEEGFNEIYQLDGGVVNYGNTVGTDHWKGKLFVFDDRLTVPLTKEGDAPVVGKCKYCGTPNEDYFNCANMDCNTLFLCCSSCLEEHKGCCQDSCSEAPRVRPYAQQNPHKPFRRWHHYAKSKEELGRTTES